MNLKKNFWGVFCVMVCMVLVTSGGCKKSSDAQTDPSGALLQTTDCKEFAANTAGQLDGFAAAQHEDCIEYRYNGTNTLILRHINSGFNCCPGEITGEIQFNGSLVTITERESEASCHCKCLFDLDYEIANLSPGEYTIRIMAPYVEENDQVLEFTLQLQSAASGTHCLTRNYYPWI